MQPVPNAMPRRHEILTRDCGAAMTGLRLMYKDVRADLPEVFDWRSTLVDLGPVRISRGACSAAVTLDVAPLWFVLNLSINGTSQTACGRHSTTIMPKLGAGVISPGGRSVWRTSGAILTSSLQIDPQFLTSQLEALTGEVVVDPLVFALALRTDIGCGAYVDRLCRFIIGEMDSGLALEQPAITAGLIDSLTCALLSGHLHSHSDRLHRSVAPSSEAVVRRVEEYLDGHAGGPISTTDLAAVSSVSVQSIEAAFRQHRGTSPAAFLRARRLQRARRTLLDDVFVPVAQVAYAAGFTRPATFSAEYFKAFGERPEDTRRRGVGAAGPVHPAVVDGLVHADSVARLSKREREVCLGLTRGMLNKQIAAELGLSERTVKEYRANALAKLGVTSAAEVATIFSKFGG